MGIRMIVSTIRWGDAGWSRTRLAIPMQHSRLIFADAVFSRELRIDLFNDMLLADKPLVDEQRDALDLVKRWLD